MIQLPVEKTGIFTRKGIMTMEMRMNYCKQVNNKVNCKKQGIIAWRVYHKLHKTEGEKPMKRLLACILMIVCLFTMVSAAFAEGETWHCDTCNEDRNTEFCPTCGAKKPDPEPEPESWICPSCGKELPAEYSFCPDDGSKKEDAAVSSVAWPVMDLEGVDTALSPLGDDSKRHQSYFGPGTSYPGDGAYKPKKATSVKALFRIGNFVLVDMTYQTVGRRILYFRSGSLTYSDVENVTLTSHPAKVTGNVAPLQGPGAEYDNVLQTNVKDPSRYEEVDLLIYDFDVHDFRVFTCWYDKDEDVFCLNRETGRYTVYLNEGEKINVFFETNGWVYAEFNCCLGTVRAWIPASCVAAE